MLRLALYCLMVLSLIGSTEAAGISLSQSLDRTETAFEEPVRFEIVITWPGPQSAYLFEGPLRPVLDRLQAREFTSAISSQGAGDEEVTRKIYTYALVPTSSGTGRIEPITISYLTWPDSIPGQLVTEAMSVYIEAPAPIEDKRSGRWIVWLVVAIVAVAAGSGGVIWWRSRAGDRRRAAAASNPAEQFLESLARLRTEAGSDLKKFQTGLYRELVAFLRAAYDISPDSEVEDLAAALESHGMPEPQREKMTAWLRRAEKEKFAPAQAAPGETIRLEAEIRDFFEKNMMPSR
jgi:hypothetical protein